jgi:GT2 family glycosyltransferase
MGFIHPHRNPVVRNGALLHTPRHNATGQLLDCCQNWRTIGIWAAKLQRARKRRFLSTLKSPHFASAIQEILRHDEGRDFDAALREWTGCPPAESHSPGIGALGETPGAVSPELRCSVIINTVDRCRHLAITIDSLRPEWNAKQDELIVVLGPTADESVEFLRDVKFPHRLIHCPDRNLAVSRNLGLQASCGRFVAYLDDDASPESGWLAALLKPLENDPEIGVSAGFVLDGKGRRFLNQFVVTDTLGRIRWFSDEASALLEINRLGTHRAFLTATGCNMAFRRETLARVGGFDPAYPYFLEETDAVWRVRKEGLRCVPTPQSRVRHRLGTNIIRKKGFQVEDRLVLARSQIHYIGKFGKTTFSPSEIEGCIWERALLDLGRIGWDCGESASAKQLCGDLQKSYLMAVTADLRRKIQELSTRRIG